MFSDMHDEAYNELREIRKALGLKSDAPHGYVMSAIHHLIFRPGVKVKTRPEGALHDKEYTEEGCADRRWGVTGTVTWHHDSPGLCFDVKHADGTEGTYDPDEIEVVK